MATVEQERRGAVETFRQELVQVWREMPGKGLFFSLLAGWAALFHFFGNSTFGYIETASLFRWMHYVYSTSPDDGHGLLIPVVVLVLFWWKKEELLAVSKKVWWPGVGLVAAGLMLHLVGYMVQQGRLSIVGFFVGLYGIMGAAWGWGFLRASFFPFFLFIFCVPLGTEADSLTFPLRLMVSMITSGFSQWVLGIDVIRVGTQLFDPLGAFQYDVAAACSGIRSLTVLLALTTIYGFLSFERWWKRALMVMIAIPLAVLGNVIRITGVVVTAEAFGQEAGMKFHDAAGFITFPLAVIGTLLLGMYLREDGETEMEKAGKTGGEEQEKKGGEEAAAVETGGTEGRKGL